MAKEKTPRKSATRPRNRKKGESDEAARRMVLAFLGSKEIEQTQDYLTRGRRFRTTDIGTLEGQWVATWRALANGEKPSAIDFDDVKAEMRLRRHEPPDHLVRDDVEKLQKLLAPRVGEYLTNEQAHEEVDNFLKQMSDKQRSN